MQLSKYFTLEQLIASSTAQRLGVDNTPDTQSQANLQQTAVLADQIYDAIGSFVVTSGYRSPALNSALHNSSTTSLHMRGKAIDVRPDNDTPDDYFWKLASNPVSALCGEIINESQVEGIVHFSTPYQDASGATVTGALKYLDPVSLQYFRYTPDQLAAEPRYTNPAGVTAMQALQSSYSDTSDTASDGSSDDSIPGFSAGSDIPTYSLPIVPIMLAAAAVGGIAFLWWLNNQHAEAHA